MRFCIVTPTFNRCEMLRQSIDSVLSQRGVDVRLIVVDGGSRDGTLKMLAGISDPRLKCVASHNCGQAAAINRGMELGSADVLAWLNDDDLYLPGALAKVEVAMQGNAAAQWVCGRCRIIDARGEIIRRGISAYKDRSLRQYSYAALLRENFISQPAVFWRSSFKRAIGPLDESLEYAMDYDLWLRMGRAAPPLVMDETLACFRVHPRSKSGRLSRQQFIEQYRVARRYLEHDRAGMLLHRLNVEKIILSYRLMRAVGY